LFGWFIPADRARLQALLDHTFAGRCPEGVEYRALADTVLLTFANIDRVSSFEGADAELGYTQEGDVVLWVLAGRYRDGQLERVLWHMAYIWVDNPIALVIGREVHGFPKALGKLGLPRSIDDTRALFVDALAIEQRGSKMQEVRLLELERTDEEAPAKQNTFGAFHGMFGALKVIGELSRQGLGTLITDVRAGRMPMVFLKQFRDAMQPDRACYQAVVEADATVQELRGAGVLPGRYRLRIRDTASHKIAETLGIDSEQTLGRGFYVQMTFSMDLGRVIHERR
jgi:hypothetical protein